jgi:hypothetical protein
MRGDPSGLEQNTLKTLFQPAAAGYVGISVLDAGLKDAIGTLYIVSRLPNPTRNDAQRSRLRRYV